MKTKSILSRFLVVLSFFVINSAAAQTVKPAAVSHQQAANLAARKQLAAWLADFRNHPDDDELRDKIIQLAKSLTPAPVIPLPAKADFTKAAVQLKTATTADEFRAAAALFEQATVRVPWYAEAYYNCASAYVKAGSFGDAERNLVLYMAAVRSGTNTSGAEDLQREIDRQQTRYQFQQALLEFPNNPSDAGRVRLVKLAQQMQPPPEIPEEAKQHDAKAKALSAGASRLKDYEGAIAEFKSALLIAPWWAEPERELAATQAAARQFEFQLLLEQLRHTPRYSQEDQNARRKIIAMVRAMPAPPPASDEVMRAMVRGETMVKMGGTGSYEAAAKEMERAVLTAPWMADAYFNLAIVQQKAEMFEKAMENLQLSVLAAPESPNIAAVKAKIYELEILQEDKAKMQGLHGEWQTEYGSKVKVSVDGNKVHVGSFDLVRNGRALEGLYVIEARTVRHPDYPYRAGPCEVPGETVQVTGSIGADGRSIELAWTESEYSTTWGGGSFWDVTKYHCTGVALKGKTEHALKITR